MSFDFSNLKLPIIQAPMAGGVNTNKLAAAVANAGGVGSFGFAYSTPEKIHQDLIGVKALTSGPINANFFVFNSVELPDFEMQNLAIKALQSLPISNHLSFAIPQKPFYPNLEQLLEPVWQERPAILSFHFGIPPRPIIEKAQALKIAVGMTATSVDEALAIEKAGANFIVAQGIEAGGHRGIFDPNVDDENLSLDVLLPLMAKRCHLPIVAAGAIMNGYDIDRVMRLGACAVQMGTAFICCDESGASPAHREFILTKPNRGTAFTTGFSGRRAQGIRNEFIVLMEAQLNLPFPIQNTLTGSLRQIAIQLNNGEYQSLWAGTAYAKSRSMPAGELMKLLGEELSLLRTS